MAKSPAKNDAPAEPKSKKGLIIAIVAVLVVVVGGVAGAFMTGMLGGGGEEGGSKKAKKKGGEGHEVAFVTLEPFTVNLTRGDDGDHYLQVGIDVKLADKSYDAEVKEFMPQVRNNILLLLSSKRVNDINNVEGKKKLSEEIREQINKPLGVSGAEEGVIGVYFTSFVVQ